MAFCSFQSRDDDPYAFVRRLPIDETALCPDQNGQYSKSRPSNRHETGWRRGPIGYHTGKPICTFPEPSECTALDEIE